MSLVAHEIHFRGGMERSMAELIRRGHLEWEFVVVASHLDPMLVPLVRWERIQVPAHPLVLKFLVFYVIAALRMLRLQPRLVHTMGAIVPSRADLVSVHFNNQAVLRGRYWTKRRGLRARRLHAAIFHRIGAAAETWSYGTRRARLLACVSPGLAREIERDFNRTDAVVIPNGVDARRLTRSNGERERVQAELATPPKDMVALFVGGDWERKGLSLVVDAVAQAIGQGSQVTLWVVGGGDFETYSARARALGVGERVRFFGQQGDVSSFYRAADVFVVASAYETFAIAVYEAAAAGLPVISTAVHGVVDVIADGVNGLLVRRDAADIARALILLAGSPQRRTDMGARAAEAVAAYTWERNYSLTAATYRSLLSDSGRRASRR